MIPGFEPWVGWKRLETEGVSGPAMKLGFRWLGCVNVTMWGLRILRLSTKHYLFLHLDWWYDFCLFFWLLWEPGFLNSNTETNNTGRQMENMASLTFELASMESTHAWCWVLNTSWKINMELNNGGFGSDDFPIHPGVSFQGLEFFLDEWSQEIWPGVNPLRRGVSGIPLPESGLVKFWSQEHPWAGTTFWMILDMASRRWIVHLSFQSRECSIMQDVPDMRDFHYEARFVYAIGKYLRNDFTYTTVVSSGCSIVVWSSELQSWVPTMMSTFQTRSSRFFTLQILRFPYSTCFNHHQSKLFPAPVGLRGKIRVPVVSLFTAGLLLSQLIVSGQKWGVYNVPGMPVGCRRVYFSPLL